MKLENKELMSNGGMKHGSGGASGGYSPRDKVIKDLNITKK